MAKNFKFYFYACLQKDEETTPYLSRHKITLNYYDPKLAAIQFAQYSHKNHMWGFSYDFWEEENAIVIIDETLRNRHVFNIYREAKPSFGAEEVQL